MDHLLRLEDGVAPEGVAQSGRLHQIHVSTEYGFQVRGHADKIEQAPARVGSEGYEDVNIAVWTKLSTEHRTKEG